MQEKKRGGRKEGRKELGAVGGRVCEQKKKGKVCAVLSVECIVFLALWVLEGKKKGRECVLYCESCVKKVDLF